MTDLLSGVVQLKMDTYATGNPHVAAGKLRALAYAAEARSPLMPDVPTVAEMGLPGYEGILWIGTDRAGRNAAADRRPPRRRIAPRRCARPISRRGSPRMASTRSATRRRSSAR